MTLQTLGTFKKTDTGFEGRIQTLLSNLKLYIEESDKSADYVIKSKYSLVGYGWHGTDDVVEGGNVIRAIKLVFREPFCQSSIEATLTEHECEWIMQWNPFPKYRPFPLPPFIREPQIVVEAESCVSKMVGEL